MIAINDALMLESSIYILLKKHFKPEPYYVDLLELFHEVSAATASSAPSWLTLLHRSRSKPKLVSSWI